MLLQQYHYISWKLCKGQTVKLVTKLLGVKLKSVASVELGLRTVSLTTQICCGSICFFKFLNHWELICIPLRTYFKNLEVLFTIYHDHTFSCVISECPFVCTVNGLFIHYSNAMCVFKMIKSQVYTMSAIYLIAQFFLYIWI